MSNQDSNRTFKANLLGLSLRSGVMPALALSLLAGSAQAQDSGGFGLLAALKNQAQAGAQAQDEELADEGLSETQLADELYNQDVNEGAANEDELEDLAGAVGVSEYDLVDLHVNNEDLGNILQLLSIQSQRNIISSNNVNASVTADLYGVTFYEALDAILHVNGYGYIEKGNFIYVYTAEELAEFEALSRRPVTRIIDLDYLNATDAAEFAKMLLSENGSITSNAATEAFTITDGVPTGADNYANTATLVISDFEENVTEIEALIKELDTKPTQILVEATILQTTLNEANAFGMDFALIKNLDFTDFVGTGGPLSVVDALINGQGETVDGTAVDVPANGRDSTGVQSTVGNTAGSGGLKAGFVNGDVGVFMRVLDEITDVTVVSNPKLLTLNRQPARVLVGTRVGYLNSTTTDTSTTQSVEFLDVGTQLSVRPFVSKNGYIRLELRPQVSNFTLRQVSDGAGNNVTIPDEDTTEMNTNVMARDGQTVVLGGLFTETTSTTRRQVPVLGDIPLIGSAFKGFDDSTRRSEIIFLITPSIINDTVLAETGEMGNQYLEHARYGARKGLLPWSRERRVGQLLISARQLADEGEIEQALSKVDRALRLMPMSPDARTLRTELTGQLRTMPSRSLIEGMLHNELGYGGKTSAVGAPNAVNPFVTPQGGQDDQQQVAQSEQDQDSGPVYDPSSDADYAYDPSLDEQIVVQNPADPAPFVDPMGENQYIDDPMLDPEYVYVDPDEVSDTSSYRETPSVAQQTRMYGPMVPEQYADLAAGEGAEQGVGQSGDGYDQMKAVVTGAQTEVDFSQAAPGVAPAFPSEKVAAEESAYREEPHLSVAEGFSGQLVIPLPGGGALRLEWPLGFEYVVNGDNPEATFTEVPTDGADFADFAD